MDAPMVTRQFTWFALNCARYESHWMAMHRFLWPNALTGRGLWCALTGRSGESAIPFTANVPQRFAEYIRESELTHDFSKHLSARSLHRCLGAGLGDEIESTDRIRFCPLCLAECFHSPLFQLANVDECPFHGTPLRTTCEHCGSHYMGSLILDPRDFDFPLCCRSCHRPFFGDDVHKVFAGFPRASTTFRRGERWLEEIRSVRFHRVSTLGGEPVHPRDFRFICDCTVLLREHSSAHAPWQTRSGGQYCATRRPLSQTPACKQFAGSRQTVPLDVDFEAATAIAKSINRMLTRLVRRACRHRQTMELQWTRALRPFQMLQPLLLVSPHDCPCCAVLDRWRAYAGKVIAMRNIARGMRQFGPIYDEQADSGYRSDFCLEPGEFAVALISSFTWFAVGMDKLLSDLAGGAELDPWYPARSYHQSMKDGPALPMDVFRFDIDRHGHEFSTEKESIFVSYSLDFARDALRRCFERHRRGLLWPSLKPSDRAEAPFGKQLRDAWYVSMSERLNTGRRSPKMWVMYPPQSTSSCQRRADDTPR